MRLLFCETLFFHIVGHVIEPQRPHEISLWAHKSGIMNIDKFRVVGSIL